MIRFLLILTRRGMFSVAIITLASRRTNVAFLFTFTALPPFIMDQMPSVRHRIVSRRLIRNVSATYTPIHGIT